eukprot:jgi/Tetstr1/420425/TSEL_011540.t1
MHRGITLGANSVDNLRLVGYADADFAPADPLQRRSRARGLKPGNPEASYTNFYVKGTYLDDFFLKFDRSMSPWQHDLMYLSCINTLHKHGLSIKRAKSEWPSTRCEFVCVLIDTVRGTIAVSAARCDKVIWPHHQHPIQPLEHSYRRAAAFPGIWTKAMIPRRLHSDPQLPLDGSAGFKVISSDASGWAGGVWRGVTHLPYVFTPERPERLGTCAILCELIMVPWTNEQIGTQLTTGSNVLFRLDNTSSMGAVNMAPHLT